MSPRLLLAFVLTTGLLGADRVSGQTSETPRTDILPPETWQQIDAATHRGLRFLASQQRRDGSFPTNNLGQPAVTALATMAFMQSGHLPGQGPYGKTLDRAIDFMLRCQRRNGLFARRGPNGPIVMTQMEHHLGVSVSYNHAITALALSEAYGVSGGADDRLREPIERALDVSLKMQKWPKQRGVDRGGLRYFHKFSNRDSDLSVVGWTLKFMRSAKNAGFEPPEEAINEAVDYVLRCFDPRLGSFEYEVSSDDRRTRAMAGVGILALAHTSRHNRPEALAAADALLQHGFQAYNRQARMSNYRHNSDRYHYGVFYCTLAMYQIGGRHWDEFFPPTARTLLAHQNNDGSWDPEGAHDGQYGRHYTTSLVLLALGAPNQLLPIYQR